MANRTAAMMSDGQRLGRLRAVVSRTTTLVPPRTVCVVGTLLQYRAVQRSICRSGSQLAVVSVLALIIAGQAGAAPPPTGPGTSGIQQYIETIPTATGGATSGSTGTTQGSGGSGGAATQSGGETSSGGGTKTVGDTSADSPDATTTSDATKNTSDRGALKAVGHAGGSGLSSVALLGIVLAATALAAIAFGVIRRRRRSQP
jgi:hypothetical protein